MAGDPSQYTGANWTNATQIAQVGQILPGTITVGVPTGTPITVAATSLQSNATFRANMLAAGLPTNFWVLSRGFLIAGNYMLATRYTFANDTLRQPLNKIRNVAGIRHAFKMNWTYDIPVGWEFDGVGRVQSGNLLSFGNVRLVGMTQEELQAAYKVQFRNDPTTGQPTVYMLPQDIIDNTIRAFNVSATSPTGYAGAAPTGRYLAPANGPDCLQIVRGDCAPRDVFVNGPVFARFDISTRKTFPLSGRRNFQFEVDVLNAFNAIGFNAVAQASSSPTINQVTSAYTDINNTFDPGGRVGQLMFRFNW